MGQQFCSLLHHELLLAYFDDYDKKQKILRDLDGGKNNGG